MINTEVNETVIEIEKYLRKVDNIIRKKGREILRDFNITVPQFLALQWLINHGSLTISELSQKMSLACSTITDLIDRMEKNDLVERIRDDKDKRVVRVEAKNNGHELLKKVMNERHKYLGDKLKDFKNEDKVYLMKNLKVLFEAMEEENYC